MDTSLTEAAAYAPVRLLEVELGEPLPTISAIDTQTGSRYRRARCLIRLHTFPIGIVEFELSGQETNPDEYIPHIWHALSQQVNEHLLHDGLQQVTELAAAGLPGTATPRCIKEREEFLTQAPFVSVIVSTRDRPQRVQGCLRSLLALHYPGYEIIVVDNAPSSSATSEFIRQTYGNTPRVRYVREDRPGLSWGRNCGIMAAKGEILAFTDDDVMADPYWLAELVQAYRVADDVACATGLILPSELETPPQFWYEEYGGLNKGFARRAFTNSGKYPEMPLYPYTAGRFGTGANMSFSAAFLRSIGGFDPALGAGRPARGAEDLAAFFQVISRGHTLVYTPRALLYHPSYRVYADLRKQLYGNGVGLTAYLMKSVLERPRLLFDLFTKVPYGLFFALSSRSPKNRKKSAYYPKDLTLVELKGMLYGPLAYWRSRRSVRGLMIAESSSPTREGVPVL